MHYGSTAVEYTFILQRIRVFAPAGRRVPRIVKSMSHLTQHHSRQVMSNRSRVAADLSGDNGTADRSQQAMRRNNLQPPNKENIFLFWPNIIGTFRQSHMLCKILIIAYRLHPRRARRLVSLLHATPSTTMYCIILHQLPARCAGRLCSACVQSVYTLWGCTGYGHGSMYDVLSSGIPGDCAACVCSHIPGSD